MKMNKPLQDKAFRQEVIRRSKKGKGDKVTAAEQHLYRVILQIANDAEHSEDWRYSIDISRRQLETETAMTSKTIQSARQGLTEKGFIVVERPRQRRECMKYHIVPLYEQSKETEEQAVARQAQETAEIEAILSKYDVNERKVYSQLNDVLHLGKLVAAQALETYTPAICRDAYAETLKAKEAGDIKKTVRGYFEGVAKRMVNDKRIAGEINAKLDIEQKAQAQARQAAQEQADANYTPPTVDKLISDIA